MRKSLFIFAALMITSVTCFATVPADHPKLAEYFAKRYVTLVYNLSSYDIDFKEVQAVLWDGNGHISLELAPTDKGIWGIGGYWIIFKNGRYVMVGDAANIKWKEYRDFLQANPQFLSIP